MRRQTAGGFTPDARGTRTRALRLITSDDAFASLEEKRGGTLERGDCADLTVILENLFELPQGCIAAATVLMTITNGQIAFEGETGLPARTRNLSFGRSTRAVNQAGRKPA
jgi:predicted amidohydrolase YtcJ